MYDLVRRIFFSISEGDAEEAHLLLKQLARRVERLPPLLSLLKFMYEPGGISQPREVAEMKFPNPVGLAAGMDKDGDMVLLMQELGFGSIEIGTVVPLPQPGNPRPRLFRLPGHQALIHRMGFNSSGADAVWHNLMRVRNKIKVPIGISAGKMLTTALDDAVGDYLTVFEQLALLADYLAANVSSPNTKDLRKLQGRAYLLDLVNRVVDQEAVRAKRHGVKPKPVFVKIAPDLTEADLVETVEACIEAGARGIIACNTTMSRPDSVLGSPFAEEKGGLSGPPVFPLALEKVKWVRKHAPNLPIIGVGGIDSGDKARQMVDAGADLIQILTGLVYKGPALVRELRGYLM